MKSFLIKGLIFVSLLFIADYAVGAILHHLYFLPKSRGTPEITYAFRESKEEVIILGSSRAKQQYVSNIFSKILGYSSYNFGGSGQSIFYHQTILTGILNRYTPKIVILDLRPNELYNIAKSYDRLSIFLPYYRDYEFVRPIIFLRNPSEKINFLSKTYPYNSSLLDIAKTLLEPQEQADKVDNGYAPVKNLSPKRRSFRFPDEEAMGPTATIDENKIKALEYIISASRKASSKIYIVVSPMYQNYKEFEDSLQTLKSVLAQYDLELLDYSSDPNFLGRRELFRDWFHLNPDGAELFSEMLAKMISQKEF